MKEERGGEVGGRRNSLFFEFKLTMTHGELTSPSPPLLVLSVWTEGGWRAAWGGVDFRGYAAFARQRRVVDASHVEDDGAERLN